MRARSRAETLCGPRTRRTSGRDAHPGLPPRQRRDGGLGRLGIAQAHVVEHPPQDLEPPLARDRCEVVVGGRAPELNGLARRSVRRGLHVGVGGVRPAAGVREGVAQLRVEESCGPRRRARWRRGTGRPRAGRRAPGRRRRRPRGRSGGRSPRRPPARKCSNAASGSGSSGAGEGPGAARGAAVAARLGVQAGGDGLADAVVGRLDDVHRRRGRGSTRACARAGRWQPHACRPPRPAAFSAMACAQRAARDADRSRAGRAPRSRAGRRARGSRRSRAIDRPPPSAIASAARSPTAPAPRRTGGCRAPRRR